MSSHPESPSELDRVLVNVPMVKKGYRPMLELRYQVLSPYTEWGQLLREIVAGA